ncbi:MAG: SIMPL domain-containing protein [Vicinamibacterales bacterium]
MLMLRTTAAVAALAWASLATAQTSAPKESDLPVVVTSGEATVKRAPDRAFVAVAAESRAKTSREAQKMNADAMTAVMAKLKSAGLAGDAIQTTAYDIQPEFDYNNGKQTLRDYVARNAIEVRVDDLPKLGEVLDLAVGAGATSVSGVRFDLKDRTGAEREALQKAVEDARARANAAAAGAGLKVERIVRIEEQRSTVMPPPRPFGALRNMAMAEAAPTPVVAGDLEIRATVTLTAAIR